MTAPRRVVGAVAALVLLSGALVAQEGGQTRRTTNAPPAPSGATPRTAGGRPDLTGVWNALGDNLNGVPNQIANNGVVIESATSARDRRGGHACGRASPTHRSPRAGPRRPWSRHRTPRRPSRRARTGCGRN